jgi:hypothetical protein
MASKAAGSSVTQVGYREPLLPRTKSKADLRVRSPFAPAWADPLGARIWDQLEAQVEEGVKAVEKGEQGETVKEGGQRRTAEDGGKKVSCA